MTVEPHNDDSDSKKKPVRKKAVPAEFKRVPGTPPPKPPAPPTPPAVANGSEGNGGGKPRVVYANGRKAALELLDLLLASTPNIQKLACAMQTAIDVDALGFYREIAMPLTPKTMIEGDGATKGTPEQFAAEVRAAQDKAVASVPPPPEED